MKRSTLNVHALLLILAALLAACSGPAENSSSTNPNSAQQANSNSAPSPAANDTAPAAAPSPPMPAVETMPPPVKPPEVAANPAQPTTAVASAPNGRLPKLVVPDKKFNFGKQSQDKTIVRVIAIRNGGKADLNIESVVPS